MPYGNEEHVSWDADAYYSYVPIVSWKSFWISFVVTENSEFSMRQVRTREGLTGGTFLKTMEDAMGV